MSLLTITDLQVRYGQVTGTNQLSFQVAEGETLALVGSNGAGKSSTMKAVMGLVPLAGGDILWRGQSLKGKKPSDIVRLGIGFSPEGRRVFPQLSVYENLKVGAFSRNDGSFEGRIEQIYGYFPRLKERSSQRSSSLSGGEQQMLAMARVMIGEPKLLLIDEPSEGLAPMIVAEIYAIVSEMKASGCTILLVEQNLQQALSICDRFVAIERGRIVLTGMAQDEQDRAKLMRTVAV